MAPTQDLPSFDKIILAGRRKKAEQLAGEIFGKGRRDSAPQLGARDKTNGSLSLASRITKPGKRSTSSSSLARNKPKSILHREIVDITDEDIVTRKNPFNAGNVSNINRARNGGAPALKNFSIRGAAGPYVVIGSNFAPGTTGADIQSAMEPVAGQMVSCNVITSSPTVIAEMVFEDKNGADKVVSTLNNQRASRLLNRHPASMLMRVQADGRLLHVYLKNGPPTKMPSPPPLAVTTNSVEAASQSSERPDLTAQTLQNSRSRSVNEKRAEPEVQDGRYGFESKEEEMEVEYADDRRPPQGGPSDNRASDTRGSETRYNCRPESVNNRYNGPRPDRPDYRSGYPREYRGDRGYERNGHFRNGGYRQPEQARLYSDDLYPGDRRGYR